MVDQETREKVLRLTDTEASEVLNRVIAGLAARDRQLLQAESVKTAITSVADSAGKNVKFAVDEEIPNKAEAAKALLLEFTSNTDLRGRVEAAIATNREVLVEPVTAALIMAGILVLLQTNAGLKIKREDGKTSVDFNLEKKPTADSILEKFFAFFK